MRYLQVNLQIVFKDHEKHCIPVPVLDQTVRMSKTAWMNFVLKAAKRTYTVFLSGFMSFPLNSAITSRKERFGGGPPGLLGSCNGCNANRMPSLKHQHMLSLHILIPLLFFSRKFKCMYYYVARDSFYSIFSSGGVITFVAHKNFTGFYCLFHINHYLLRYDIVILTFLT